MVFFFLNKSHPCLKNLLNLLYFNLCVCTVACDSETLHIFALRQLHPPHTHTLPIAHVLHTRTNVLGGFHFA